MRRVFAKGGSFAMRDDVGMTVERIIAAAEAERPPLRLVLGTVSYQHIERALASRLDAVRARKPAEA